MRCRPVIPEWTIMKKLLPACLGVLLAFAFTTTALAQRTFPDKARRGDLKAYEYPSMKIGSTVYRLTPGSRIFNRQNLIIMPASLRVQTAPVMYLLDMSGGLSRIWLLTEEEAASHPVPR
jgi:hypothetical protein